MSELNRAPFTRKRHRARSVARFCWTLPIYISSYVRTYVINEKNNLPVLSCSTVVGAAGKLIKSPGLLRMTRGSRRSDLWFIAICLRSRSNLNTLSTMPRISSKFFPLIISPASSAKATISAPVGSWILRSSYRIFHRGDLNTEPCGTPTVIWYYFGPSSVSYTSSRFIK